MIEPIIFAFGILCSTAFGVTITYCIFALTRAVFVRSK